jgi:hypothetical protein
VVWGGPPMFVACQSISVVVIRAVGRGTSYIDIILSLWGASSCVTYFKPVFYILLLFYYIFYMFQGSY